MTATTGLPLYDRTATACATGLLRAYSTSFSLACRLCSPEVRGRIADLYALVRIADEIVDGPAAEAGLDADERRRLLDDLESETERALGTGYSANLVVHAFARTARVVGIGIGTELTRPFFTSMRRDLSPVRFTEESELDAYVHGSAEVVGLMCVRVFRAGLTADDARDRRWDAGARALGSAFQRVNFLRDLAEDTIDLGRDYFPGVDATTFTDADRDRILDRVDDELALAAATARELPASSRRAVRAAHALYADLSARLRTMPAEEILSRRARVPGARKAALVLRAMTGGGR